MQVAVKRTKSVVTYLQMSTPVPATRSWPGKAFRISHVRQPSPGYYRYLYAAVGGDWHWLDRLQMEETALCDIVQAPGIEVHVLSEHHEPVGYGEIDRSDPAAVKIAYFGLMPMAIGRGLGRWFLEQIVARAWRSQPKLVWLHTCDLDHPRALDNYLAAGFEIVDRREEELLTAGG